MSPSSGVRCAGNNGPFKTAREAELNPPPRLLEIRLLQNELKSTRGQLASKRIASIQGLFALWLGYFAPAPALAFGEFGHQLIGALAEDMLTPKARSQVQALLGPAGGPATLAAASTWADEIRTLRPASRPWHYITLQIEDPRPDVARADTPNAVTALDRELAVLSKPDADRYAREEALKWVIHLVGDLHQPLHAGERHDKGGNLMRVKLNRRAYALHAVWDYALLERLHLPLDSAKAMLEREIANDAGWVSRNAQGTPAQWAGETHALSAACYVLHGKPMPAGRQVQLDRAYAAAATLVSLSQIKRAGTRLAFVLNRAFDHGSGNPVLRASPGKGPTAWFAHADSLREDDGQAVIARYAWSANSKVYHLSGCADVKRIHKRNLVTANLPPPGKTLHPGCPRN